MASSSASSEEDSLPGMIPANQHEEGSSVEEEEEDDQGHWSDWESEEGGEDLPTKCLFSDRIVPTPGQALVEDKATTGFDLCEAVRRYGLDFYGAIRLINFIRSQVKGEVKVNDLISRSLQGVSLPFDPQDDSLLIPVVENDPLLFSIENLLAVGGVDLEDDDKDHTTRTSGAEEVKQEGQHGDDLVAVTEENHLLKLEVEALQSRFSRLSEITAEMDADVKVSPPKLDEDNDTYYFESYAHFSIHETMLRDEVRTGGYARAIQENAEALIKDKVVLDIGCGTGVLSMFCAKAGAARVVGVDCSDIINKAREIVTLNKLDDRISLVKGKMEEVSLPVGGVDVIVSEWMGYCLLYESMLPSVLWARDRYLAPGGSILPNRCTMFIQGIEDLDGRLRWWEDVHGLDMRCLVDMVMEEPSVEVVNAKAVMSTRCLIKDINIMTIRDQELDFEVPFEVVVERACALKALMVFFDTEFSYGGGGAEVTFSTGPDSTPTHWKQTVFWLKEAPKEALAPGDIIKGTFRLGRNHKNPRELDVRIVWQVVGSGGKISQLKTQLYHLGS